MRMFFGYNCTNRVYIWSVVILRGGLRDHAPSLKTNLVSLGVVDLSCNTFYPKHINILFINDHDKDI